jgi:hypothetical protein
MAYVAFDLDNTLGFFELTNPLAFLWSPDFLENPEQSAANGRFDLTAKLHVKLKRARQNFANNLLADPELLNLVLRPNLDVIFPPLIQAKKAGKLKAIIIYSNTGVTYSMELAKYLIEKKYKTPGLISLMADHWHPLRVADRPRYVPEGRYVQPEKTIKTLHHLFKAATGQKGAIAVDKIMFMDDRNPKHKLQEQEAEGLTYIVPTAFHPRITDYQKRAILFLALETLDKGGLLGDTDYISSGFCHRDIPYEHVKQHRIDGFPALFSYVWEKIDGVESGHWAPDTLALESRIFKYLDHVKA